MRAFVEPVSYCNGLATAWLARIYAGDDEGALCFAELRPFVASCVIVREKVGEVSFWGLLGTIDRPAFKDIRRAMRAQGISSGGWGRKRDYV